MSTLWQSNGGFGKKLVKRTTADITTLISPATVVPGASKGSATAKSLFRHELGNNSSVISWIVESLHP